MPILRYDDIAINYNYYLKNQNYLIFIMVTKDVAT